MKVAQFNTFPYGGAATAAKRIHEKLRAKNIDSQFFYHRNEKAEIQEPSFHQLNFSSPKFGIFTGAVQRRRERRRQKDVYDQFNTHLALRPAGQETFSMAQLPESTPLDWKSIDADVLHLHWISFFADYPSFFDSVPNDTPIVWTLHDMNAFTGGCHYSNGCSRFRFGCGGCPQVVNSSPKDVSATTFNVKQQSLQNKNLHIVTPSDWMRELAMDSKVFPTQASFQTIRLGFDLKTFQPINKSDARRALGLDTDAILIGFGAEDINNRRKGLQHLLPALENLNTKNKVESLVFGSGEIESSANQPKVNHFGYVDSEQKQALIYSAADLVVVPSREDNQPQVGLEAMACGTPVVAFDAGGIPEYVRDGQTGLIAKLGDEAHLAERISALVDNAEARATMGRRARLMMEREFDSNRQSERYLDLYRLVSSKKSVAGPAARRRQAA
ncbi:MAG: glycosyltransferase [Mariniblastus sp.]